MSPTFEHKKLINTNKTNNYLKTDNIFENPEYNLILPLINQKSNLSNSGRNIVLTNNNFVDEDQRFSKARSFQTINSSILNNYNRNNTNFNYNMNMMPSHEKEKLDYELSKLEDQYKDILTKFSILSKKRELMN